MRLIRRVREKVTAVVAVAMVSTSSLVATALPAQAHSDPHAVRAACGKGYEIVQRRDIRQTYGEIYRMAGPLIIARRRNAPGFVCAAARDHRDLRRWSQTRHSCDARMSSGHEQTLGR